MTVSLPEIAKVTGTGNGAATVFSFDPLVIYKASNLVVTHVVIATGVETLLVEGVGADNYSVSPTVFPAQGVTGSITYPADAVTPMPSTEKVVMKVVLPLEQETDLQTQGTYFPEVLETEFDKHISLMRQQQEMLDRALVMPVGVEGTVLGELPPVVAGSLYLRIKADLTGWELVELSGTGVAVASDAIPQRVALLTPQAGTNDDFARADHAHLVDAYIKFSADIHNALNFV